MLKKLFITIFLITYAHTFSLAANDKGSFEDYEALKHGLLRVVEQKHEDAWNAMQGICGHDHEAQLMHFYYLGKLHAYKEMRYFMLPID